ncbi:MAG: hypothetical protein UZ03_NOB001001898 [Nitrospira sp. OLB3]|nr:MAG: hypothetical protein UZ03_NOB001001898 [Nitrospira sp. OLB3]
MPAHALDFDLGLFAVFRCPLGQAQCLCDCDRSRCGAGHRHARHGRQATERPAMSLPSQGQSGRVRDRRFQSGTGQRRQERLSGPTVEGRPSLGARDRRRSLHDPLAGRRSATDLSQGRCARHALALLRETGQSAGGRHQSGQSRRLQVGDADTQADGGIREIGAGCVFIAMGRRLVRLRPAWPPLRKRPPVAE